MIPLTEQQKRICQNPVKAIRQKCLDCSGWSYTEVELCPLTECSLYPFRFGKNPFRTRRNMTEEQKEALRQRFKAIREKRLNKQNEGSLYEESESESDTDES